MSNEPQRQPDERPKAKPKANVQAFLTHVWRMPKWQRAMLTLAAVMLGAGTTGQLAALTGPQPTDSVTLERAAADDRPAWQRHAPALTRTGGGFIAAFVIGWLSRIFLKTMALVASLGAALFVGLSYFNVFDIDLKGAERQYKTGIAWVTDRGQRLIEALSDHIPASASTGLGLFAGFRRKK